MPHLVLIGDSVLDNAAYTAGGPAVVSQVKDFLPRGWSCDLLAVDGSTTKDIAPQLARIPVQTTHLVLSCGGNDALSSEFLLYQQTRTVAHGLGILAVAVAEFEASYRRMLEACLLLKLPIAICTVYNGNFSASQPEEAGALRAAVALFNDSIIRVAIDHRLRVIDLRLICDTPADYANPIEPSSTGGTKIARAIVDAVKSEPYRGPGAQVAA